MSRIDDNNRMAEYLIESAKDNQKLNFHEMVCWHLGTIGSILLDISRSLAQIAEHTKRR